MRACTCWLALVAAVATRALTDADSSLDVARFHGGKLNRELCSGVLVAPAIVLTTAHCAANADVGAVQVAGAQVAVKHTRVHPRFGVAHPYTNNVALLFLHGSDDSSSNAHHATQTQYSRQSARLAALPASSSFHTQYNDARFEEIQVRAESETRASPVNFSWRSCASSMIFRDDASVWCSTTDTVANATSGSQTRSVGCASAVETALGSPVVVQTRASSSSSERPVVIGLRLTEFCDSEQAFVYIPSVLDFVLPLLTSPSPTNTPAPAAVTSLGFGFNRTTAAARDGTGASDASSGSDLPATVAAGASSRSAAPPAVTSAPPATPSPSPAPRLTPHATPSARPSSWTPSLASSSSSASSSSASSRHSGADIVVPVSSLRGSTSSSRADDDISTSSSIASSSSSSSSGSRDGNAPSLLGGWTELPSLGAYSSFTALLVQNSTEALGELAGCLAILIAPRYFIADGQCAGGLTDPHVVVSLPSQRNDSASASARVNSSRLMQLLNVSRMTMLYESTATLAIIELPHAVAGMTPTTLSRSLSREFDVTDASWELVSMDNVFASQREDQSVVVKQRLVRVPSTSCSVYFYEPVPLALCFTLGAEADRNNVMGFSQGMVLHNKRLVALPQCYSAICMGGLFHDATFLAAKEDWIRNQTQDTALWDTAPLDLTSIRHDAVVDGDYIVTPQAATYAELLTHTDADVALCSGVLIAPSFVLTPASCVENATVSHVRLGLDQHVSGTAAQEVLSVRRVYIHPVFGRAGVSGANNLALLELGGMSFFLPVLLAADDMLQPEPTPSTLSASSNATNTSGSVDLDTQSDDILLPSTNAEPAKYSWTMSVSRADASILCARDSPRKRAAGSPVTQRALSGSTSGSSDASSDDVIACSSIRTVSKRTLPGTGLLAVFPEGNTVLGIDTGACATGATDTCSSHQDACFARVGTPSARAFIDSISVDHAWRTDWSSSATEFGISSTKKIAAPTSLIGAKKAVSVPPADDPGYTGSLHFDSMASDAQVGFVVGLRKDKSSQNFCGGSLIAPSYVLTAAHCVTGGDAHFVSVGSRESAGTQSELIAIKQNKVIMHPLYGKQSSISYDVAIVELEAQAYPAPIVLDNALSFDASTVFTLFGYGANSARSAALSPVMRSVQLPFYNRESCQKYFPELDASMLCAGGQPARDACTGDSGSPLVHYANGTPILVGVVSTGRNGCGTPGVPGIYGYVSTMQPFINSYVAGCSWRDEDKVVGPLLTATAAASSTQPNNPAAGTTSPTGMRTSLTDTTNGVPFEIIHSATGEDEHQLSVVKLAADTPELLQDAIKAYLLGGYSMLGGVWQRKSEAIKDARTHVTFYSSGDMTDLMTTIAEHRTKPLYQRSSRFGKRTDPSELRSACCTRA